MNCRLDVIEAVLRDECEDGEDTGGPLAQGESIVNAFVQKSMRKHRFRQNRPIAHSSDKQSSNEKPTTDVARYGADLATSAWWCFRATCA